jgi:hypothetical protein
MRLSDCTRGSYQERAYPHVLAQCQIGFIVQSCAWRKKHLEFVKNGILADPDLYARDRARFEAASSAFAAAREELTAAEEQWLALEMRREEIEGPGSSG